MSLQDISNIVISQDKLDRIGKSNEELNNTEDADNYTIQGPHREYYSPLPVITATNKDKEDEQAGHIDDVYEQGLCGIGVCKPRWIQRLANINVFVVMYGIAGIWMTTLSALLGSQVTSIERHLGMSSSKTGLLVSSNEIGYMVAVIIGSHLGKYAHIPRFLSVSGIVFGLAMIAMSFGRLVEPKVWQDQTASNLHWNITDSEDPSAKYLCNLDISISQDSNITSDANDSSVSTDLLTDLYQHTSAVSWAFGLLIGASVIGGVVKSYRIPLMTYYIETNIVNKDSSGLLIGTSFTAMLFGPPIAMFLGGYISSLPVDLKETAMSMHDQRWVGAWWLGLLIIGLACVICSIPIMFFPRHMGKKKSQETLPRMDKKLILGMLLDMPRSMLRVFHRPIFVMTLVFSCIEGLAFSGWFAFSQKYIENQFNKTSQEVSMISGAIIIFSIVLGTFIGGFVTTRLKLGVRGCAVFTLVITTGTVLMDCLNFLFGCKNSDVVGITGSRTSMMDACGCNDDIFLVCGDNKVDYISPCVAGCTNITGTTFTNCTAFNNGEAKPGLCELDCGFFIPFLVMYTLGAFFGTTTIVPGFMLTIRSVELSDQALATGASSFCQTLIGILPSPILYGKIIDSACTLWSPGGSCVLYDRERFRFLFQGVSLSLRFSSVIVLGVILVLAIRQKRREGSTDEKKKEVIT